MSNKEKKENLTEIIEILKNAIIIYNDEEKKVLDAIYVNKNSVYTGKVIKIDKNEIFIEGGGIPKNSIKKIKGGVKIRILRKIVK